MSRIYSAGQYELDYSPQRLGNYQVYDVDKQQKASAATRFSTLQPRTGRTSFIVDDNGHLLPGVPKLSNSFRTKLSPVESAPCRWPKPSPGVQSTPAATVGYKGIATTYLPRNHTVVKTVDIRGTTEAKYT